MNSDIITLDDVLDRRTDSDIVEFEYVALGVSLMTRIKLVKGRLMCPQCGACADKLIVSGRGLRCAWCNATPAQRK